MSTTGPVLWMVPTSLLPPGQPDEQASRSLLPPQTLQVIAGLRHFVVENARTARAFLKPLVAPCPIQEIQIQELDKHHEQQDWARLLAPLAAGQDLGMLSESGCPGIADPGALLARQAHARGYAVRPLVGPSAILLALIAGGLGGQCFRFNGYLPHRSPARESALQALEKSSAQGRQTELWIETPYRNEALLQAALRTLRPQTLLSVALDLGTPAEEVRTHRVADWKDRLPAGDALKERLAVFSLLA